MLKMKTKITLIVFLSLLCTYSLADWKSDANESIDRIRKSDVVITVKTPTGGVAENVKLKIRQKKHKFAFGSVIGDHLWRDYRYGQFFIDNMGWATIRSGWEDNEPNQGEVSYNDFDPLVEFCQNNGLLMRGHRVCSNPGQGSWIDNLGYDNGTPSSPDLRNALESRFDSVLNHYKGKFQHWDVYNEMAVLEEDLDCPSFPTRLDGDPNEPIRVWAYKEANRLDPNASLFVNEYSLLTSGALDRYSKRQSFIDPTLAIIDDLRDGGAPVDAIGAQSHFSDEWVEDVNAVDVLDRIDRLSAAGLPIWATEFHCEDANTTNRAKELGDFYLAVFSHPSIEGVIMWGFWEPAVDYPNAAIVDANWYVNAAGQKFLSLLADWTTEIDLTTDANGRIDFRGFHGEYEVTLAPSGTGLPTIYTLNLDAPEVMELWTEHYDNYNDGTDWYSGTDWSQVGSYNASVTTDGDFGSNPTKKLSGNICQYGAWHTRSIEDYNSSDDVILTGQVCVKTATHSTWPIASHIWMGGVALGISGDNIAYGRLDEGSYVYADYPSTPPFTNISETVDANVWYDLKIVYHQNDGNDNDVVDLYYKEANDIRWISIIKDYVANADLNDYNTVATVFCNGAGYYGYIDNLALSKTKAKVDYELTLDTLPDANEIYESYSTGSSWYSGSDWSRLLVTDAGQNTHYYDASVVNTAVAGDTTKKLSGDSYDYGAWHAHDLGLYNDYDNLVLTAQVAVGNTSTHSTWPIACHVWLGGVALGISGDNISYGQMEEARQIYTNEPTTPPFTTLESSSIEPNVWYDLKIVYRQVDGNDNDLADLYYKKSIDIEWICIATDFDADCDARDSNSFDTIFCNDSTYPGYIDNVCLQVVAPDEDYESYDVNDGTWYSGSDWSRLLVTRSDQNTYYYDTQVKTDSVGGNTSQKLCGRPYNYGAWHAHDIGYYTSKDDVIITAQAAVSGSTHSTWPIACHIWIGGVALGISGDNIAYGAIDEARYIYTNEPTSPPFTSLSFQITADTWYDLKIVYHQVDGNDNDIADLYYKNANSQDWIEVITDFNTNSDVTDSNNFDTIFCNSGTYDGYIDNVRCETVPSLYRGWSEDYADYDTSDSSWYWQSFWDRHLVTLSDSNTTYYNSSVDTNTVGSNTSVKLRGDAYNYGAWMDNKILDSWVIGHVTELEEVTLTGQVAVSTATHGTWPIACHIWIGGVALGVSGDNIAYGRLTEGTEIYWNYPTTPPFTGITETINANTWYDIKIVYHQLDGVDNDKVDLYYKNSSSSTWTTIITDYNAFSDLGDSVDTVFCNGPEEYSGYIDNLELTTRQED